ncbi:MAG: HAD family hydrolase [Hyphomicrobium sp.]
MSRIADFLYAAFRIGLLSALQVEQRKAEAFAMSERMTRRTNRKLHRDARADEPAHVAHADRAPKASKSGDVVAGGTKRTIALVYDFDGTLSPRPMQEYSFLPQLGIAASEFWAECTRVARAESADPLITYMHLMYKKAKEKGLRVDREDLVAQGAAVELYPGVEAWFDAIADYVAERAGVSGVNVRHYLVSSGLTEIIEGTKIYDKFDNVFASEYWFDAYDLPFPKRVITDTGKTQYLFRINKGLEDQFQSINTHMPENARPIPFSNMIYFGDGETDVPSMALLKKNGGHAIAVHGALADDTPPRKGANAKSGKKTKASSASTASHSGLSKCIELFKAGRCDFYAAADYRAGSDLYKRTCLLLDRMIADIRVREEMARLG